MTTERSPVPYATSFLCGGGGRHDLCRDTYCTCECHRPVPEPAPAPAAPPTPTAAFVIAVTPCDCRERLMDHGGMGSDAAVHHSMSALPLVRLDGVTYHVLDHAQVPD